MYKETVVKGELELQALLLLYFDKNSKSRLDMFTENYLLMCK